MDFLDLIFRWDSMKTWQKVVGVLIVALVILDLGFELGRNVGVVHPRDSVVHLDLSGNIISNTTHFVDDEILSGSGQILTLAHAPNPPSSLQLKWNGMYISNGSENDYILSGNMITLLIEKEPSEQLHASYRY
jgi:hypothetical protein